MTTATTATTQLVTDLTMAVEVLDEKGWAQKEYQDYQGHVCIYGALIIAIWGSMDKYFEHKYGQPEQYRFRDVTRVVGDLVPGEGMSIWNDAKGRTKEEVRSVLVMAAELAASTWTWKP